MIDKQQNIFVVLGVARSGTSVIMRALNVLGIELGNNLTPPSEWNPKGFFEDNEIVYKINGKIFSTLNFPAYGIQQLSRSQQFSSPLQEIKASAVELLKKRFASTTYWGFKDPSTVKVLGFWQDIFANLKLREHYVISLRNPLCSAQSYKDRTKSVVGLETGLLVWLMHLIPAIEETHGKKRIVVSYEFMLQNPIQQLERLKNYFDLSHVKSAEIEEYANQFIDNKLTRYKFSEDDLKNHPASAVVPLCVKTYELLVKLAKDEISFDDIDFMSEWQNIKNELEMIYPLYCYIDTILKKNRELEKDAHMIRKSFLWKIGFPFRKLNDKLRARSRKLRSEKRILRAYG